MEKINICRSIMADYEGRTGLSSNKDNTCRYLWTDAYAVFNYLELYRQTENQDYLGKAHLLIEDVHMTLGRYQQNDSRDGWISGLIDEEGKKHPTIGGLRIGKKMHERKPNQPYDADKEWDRDGQYFHYLSKWMYALCCTSQFTSNINYSLWAIELAKTAFDKFTYTKNAEKKQIYWKMSIDLTYPLVKTMGHHDPLDGLVTYLYLQHVLIESNNALPKVSLDVEIKDFEIICDSMSWATSDALGIGGLLNNGCTLTKLLVTKKCSGYESMLLKILQDVELGIIHYLHTDELQKSAAYRLAFRELGLSIGLHALELMKRMIEENTDTISNQDKIQACIDRLLRYKIIADRIENYWLAYITKSKHMWKEHRDINSIMLVTSLIPRTFLSCI